MIHDPVRAQYEALPYPARDPADEARRLIVGSPGNLPEVNHYLFAGERDFSRPFRVLVAGGGTGDGAIMLARQLADHGREGEVLHVDISTASRAVAEARALARGLDNIRFATRAIEDLAPDEVGLFDYVDCCGVLHHLEDPAQGLKTLARLLAPGGGMGVMLYGELGRTGVYPMQDMLRMITSEEPPEQRVAVARRLLKQLPQTNWLRRNPFVGDHLEGGDAGLFDLFLHARDRAYRVPEIVALATRAGLRVSAFVEPARYDPRFYLNDPLLTRRLAELDWLERCAFAELLAGNMRKHVCYLVPKTHPGPTVALPEDEDMTPVLSGMDGAEFARGIKPGIAMTATLDGHAFRFPLPRLAGAMLARMDGRRSIAAIRCELEEMDRTLSPETFRVQFDQLYAALNGLGRLFLARSPGLS